MAQPVSCDVCAAENAVQMLSNLETGETIAIGLACLPVFYGQSVLAMMDAGDHKGLPQKCQACRRVHERMTLAARPGQPTDDVGPANVRDQAGPAAHDPDQPDVSGGGVPYPPAGSEAAGGKS